MKKLFLFAILFVAGFATSAGAQDMVDEVKSLLRAEGYDIVWSDIELMERDGKVSIDFPVTGGSSYIAVVVTDDYEVNDLDIAIYNDYGDLMVEDDDIDRAAIVEYIPDYSQTMTVVVHNYDSVPSDLGFYTCEIIIARLDD